MYHWKRRMAENLAYADPGHERRRGQMDLDYQDQFWRREQRERGDAGVKQGMDRVRTPSPPPSRFNKFRVRSYDRPRAQEVPAAKKLSPSTSGKNASSERRNSWNKGPVSRLPAISSRTQNKNVELAISSKTPRRANAPLAFNRNKDQSPPHHNKDASVVVKKIALKVSPRGKTNDPTQSRDAPKGAKTPRGHVGRADGPACPNPVLTITLDSKLLPRPLVSSAPRCPFRALGPRGPSRSKSGPRPPRVCDLSASFSEDSSVGEDLRDAYREHFSDATAVSSVPDSVLSEDSSVGEDLRDAYREHFSDDTTVLSVPGSVPSEDSSVGGDSEDAYREHFSDATTASSVPDSVFSEDSSVADDTSDCPSGTGTPDSLLTPLGERLRGLDMPSYSASEEEDEDDEGRGSALWRHADGGSRYAPVRRTGSRSSSAATSPSHSARRPAHSARLLRRLQPLSSQSSTSGISSGGYSPLPALAQTGHACVAPSSPVHGTLVARGSVASPVLPELAAGHRRRPPPPSWMTSQREREEPAVPRTTFSGRRHSGPGSEQEEPEGARASLLEESSDEDEDEVEEDRCRICLSGDCLSTNPLLAPCQCSGTMRFVHQDCLKTWIQTKIDSGSDLNDVETCELCKGHLTMDLEDFDFIDYYQRHCQQQAHSSTPGTPPRPIFKS